MILRLLATGQRFTSHQMSERTPAVARCAGRQCMSQLLQLSTANVDGGGADAGLMRDGIHVTCWPALRGCQRPWEMRLSPPPLLSPMPQRLVSNLGRNAGPQPPAMRSESCATAHQQSKRNYVSLGVVAYACLRQI